MKRLMIILYTQVVHICVYLIFQSYNFKRKKTLMEWLQGYEFDHAKQCVVVRKKKTGYVDYCRPLIDCNSVCKDVRKVDSVHSSNMTKEIFSQVILL